jgi:hypothetical protein
VSRWLVLGRGGWRFGGVELHQRRHLRRGALLQFECLDKPDWGEAIWAVSPPKSRQKASPECPPPSWDQPRPQSSPRGGYLFCSTKTRNQREGAEQTFWVAMKSTILDHQPKVVLEGH